MAVIRESEIRAFAESIGAVDAAGNYTVPRSRLAAGALEYRRELAAADVDDDEDFDVDTTPTSDRLVAFATELAGSIRLEVDGDDGVAAIAQIVAHVAGALVERDGLHLRNTKDPRNE
ncbi:hypothetical protein [Rhodococcus sp. PD04]|uniref:hypothetical protein n=1 Tax=Rhodococcus sp. PD04 TaxID=3109594 RepID=UPI002DDAA885|nr:hypothetical protein [Rhodococcus sp. PD04]WSE22324.1 hypothetical protein U9J23_22160 [Rhodococcus sp. PD04]